jgi:2-hydroxy-6-oxonona-2,4-dienedioate hydrolase
VTIRDFNREAVELLGLDLHPDGRGPIGRHVEVFDESYHVLEFGSGAPIVFLHGGGPGCTGWTDFGAVVPLFSSHSRVILVDLLQYGRSSKPTVVGPMWHFHARHLARLFDTLDLERPNLVCNSWGGTQALALASGWPDSAGRMVITGSMPKLTGAMGPLIDRGRRGRYAREDYFSGPGPSLERMLALMARYEWFDAASVSRLTAEIRFRQSQDADEISCGQNPERRGEWHDLSSEMMSIEQPTLFMWGMFDGFLSPEYPLMLASMLRHGSLHVMDRASHHLQEERPFEFHSIVTAFFGEAPAAGDGVARV